MAELLTQIIQRSDTAAAWIEKNPILDNSEFGVESDTGKFKIGDGTKTWTKLGYAGGDVAELEESIANAEDKTFKIDTPTGTDTEELAKLVGVSQGDTAIVKREIGSGTGKFSYTAYVYNGTDWAAMDGNYDATNVYFNEDLVYTANIGVLTVPTSGSGTIAAKGKNISEVLKKMIARARDPEVTQPSASLTLSNAGSKEAGSKVTPTYTTDFNAGKYSYGPDTGCKVTSYSIKHGTDEKTTASGTFSEITVEDGMSWSLTGTISYSEGAVPKNNLGSEVPAKKIAAGSKSVSSSAITAYRNSFYGSINSKTGDITSTIIRALGGKSGKTLAAGNTFKAAEAVGAMRVIIAVPAPRTCTSIKDENGLNAEAISAFTKISVDVEGANGYAAEAYNVYYKDNAAACDKANNWVVTVG